MTGTTTLVHRLQQMRDEMPDMVLVQNWKIVVRCHPQYVDSTVELEGSVGNDALIH